MAEAITKNIVVEGAKTLGDEERAKAALTE